MANGYKTLTVEDGVDKDAPIGDSNTFFKIEGTETLTKDWAINVDGTPAEDIIIRFDYYGDVTLDGNHVFIFSKQIPDYYAKKKYICWANYNGATWDLFIVPTVEEAGATIVYESLELGGKIVNADISPTAAIDTDKLKTLTANKAICTGAGGLLEAATATKTELNYLSGVSSAIQTQLNAKLTTGTAALVNADVNAAAAIALSKLATTTASRALESTAGGVIQASAVTSTELGYVSGVTSAIQTQIDGKCTKTLADGDIFVGSAGNEATAVTMNGDATIINTGAITIGANKVSPSKLTSEARTEARDVIISFETNWVGTRKYYIPYKCTLDYAYCNVSKAMAATSDGYINFKDNAGNNMTGGSLVAGSLAITLSSAQGTVFTTAITGNNSFVAGDILTITSSKDDAGGECNVTLKFTRVD